MGKLTTSNYVQQLAADTERLLVRKSADETVNNSTTLQDDDELTFPVLASKTYIIEGLLFIQGPTAADLKAKFSLPAGATIQWTSIHGAGALSAVPAGPQAQQVDESGTAARAWGTIATPSAVWVRGIIVVSTTAGSVTLQWAQDAATVGDTKVLAGSHLEVRRVLPLS